MKSNTKPEWRQSGAVEFLEKGGEVVASLFPWGGHWAACLQGENIKRAQHKFQAKRYCERNFHDHYAKMVKRKANAKERAEFEARWEFHGDNVRRQERESSYAYQERMKRERVAYKARRKELMSLEF